MSEYIIFPEIRYDGSQHVKYGVEFPPLSSRVLKHVDGVNSMGDIANTLLVEMEIGPPAATYDDDEEDGHMSHQQQTVLRYSRGEILEQIRLLMRSLFIIKRGYLSVFPMPLAREMFFTATAENDCRIHFMDIYV